MKKDLLYFRGKIIILSRSDLKASRARTKNLWSIGGNFIFFGCKFWEKIKFKKKDRPPESIPVKRGWTACYFWLAHPKETTLGVDLCDCASQRYRTVTFYSTPQRLTHRVDPCAGDEPMSRPLRWKIFVMASFSAHFDHI